MFYTLTYYNNFIHNKEERPNIQEDNLNMGL